MTNKVSQEELEKEYRELVAKAVKDIEEQISLASAALSRAEEIADEYGLPFYANPSPVGMRYTPRSKHKKAPEGINNLFLEELKHEFDLYDGEYDDGWEHSAVC